MSSLAQQIKDRLGIAEVVSSYLKLEKAGVNFRARCPFHQEKTPSFFVSPARGSYHCFGCNRGGDIFSFVQDMEGLDFLGALKILAERAGVALNRAEFQTDPEREKLFAVLARAQEIYAAELKRQPAVQDYLRQRGLKTETIETFGLGWAPGPPVSNWRFLFDQLRRQNFSEALLEKSGLSTRSYDRFRNRIMFPLRDGSGRTVGFSGRIFTPVGTVDDPAFGGKYINSPQTALYDKSRFLYGYDRAKLAIRRADQAILVEGQLDLLLSHQAGITNAVAVSGTALTRSHLELLSRLTRQLVMAFDGDAAGIAAAARALSLSLSLGLEVRVAKLPLGLDPADLILKQPDAWEASVKNPSHLIDFLLAVIKEKKSDKREMAHAIKTEVYPFLAVLPERIDRAHFVGKIAALTDLAEEIIMADLSEVLPPAARPAAVLPPAPLSRRERIEEKLAGLFWWLAGRGLLDLEPALLAKLAPRRDELILQAELSYADLSAAQLQEEIRALEKERQLTLGREKLLQVMQDLAAAEREGDEAKIKLYQAQHQKLARELNHLQNH